MANRKVIITVAQTGAFQGREANANIPLTPQEIAQSAKDCIDAGAAVIHVHARNKDGVSTNDPNVYSEIGSLIRAKCDAVIEYSTAPATGNCEVAEDGMRLLYDKNLVKPEMCSLDCSLMGTTWRKRTFIHEWTREFVLKYMAKMKELQIKPELECFNLESVEDVLDIYGPSGLIEGTIPVSFVMGMERISQGAMKFSEENLDFMVSKLPKDGSYSFTTIAIGAKNHVPGLTMSVLKGGNIRVGMEDNIYYAPGQLMKSNAQMVEKMVRIIRELGYDAASPAEARAALGLVKP